MVPGGLWPELSDLGLVKYYPFMWLGGECDPRRRRETRHA